MRLAATLVLAAAAAALSGCYSDEEVRGAEKVVTALPSEVKGCEFIRDIDTGGAYATIGQARFLLKRQAYLDHATHIVETHAWPGLISPRFIGVGLSGREYRCAEGAGPKVASPKAELEYEIPSYDILFPDDEIFGDEGWGCPPVMGLGFHHFGPPPRGFGPHGPGPRGFGPHGPGPHGFGPHGPGPRGFAPPPPPPSGGRK